MGPPIQRAAFVISGFRQGIGSRGAGTYNVWRGLHDGSSAADFVSLHRWNDDWGQVASLVERLQNGSPTPPKILIAAYSWGAGWGAMRLSKELARRGFSVDSLVVSDPVYRHPLWSLSWLALLGLPIRIPRNVRYVRQFVQRKNLPAGAPLAKTPGAQTKLEAAIVLDREHEWMDDAPEFALATHLAWAKMLGEVPHHA